MKVPIILFLVFYCFITEKSKARFACDKEFFKNLTVFACTYQKRGYNRNMHFTSEEINRRFDEILGEDNSDLALEDLLKNGNGPKNNYYTTNEHLGKFHLWILQTRVARLPRNTQPGFTHLSEFSKQMELMQAQEELINKKQGRSMKIRALEKLVRTCCFEDNPCFIANFSRIC